MIKIALDPGHFGGFFSILEDRHFIFESKAPVKEGDLNFEVALLLKKMLEDANFEVLLSRGSFSSFKDGSNFTKKEFEI